MNKKGFAISIVLYAVVFVIITIFYILLGIVKSRYTVTNNLRNNVFSNLNSYEHIFTKLDKDELVNILTVNPNGGTVVLNGTLVNTTTSIINYAGETVTISDVNRDDSITQGEFTVNYDSNGGNINPDTVTVSTTNIKKYQFNGWNNTGSCGSLVEDVYTFSSGNASECVKTAIWVENESESANDEIVLAAAPTRHNYHFVGWKSSVDNQIYEAGSNYIVTNDTIMTGQWNENPWAKDISYEKVINGVSCDNVQCAIDELYKMVK